MIRKVRILIADDEVHIRKLLNAVCSSISGVEIVGEAADGEEVISKFSETQPDVVLLDINMPKVTGLDALKQIKEIDVDALVIMLTALNTVDVVKDCIRWGASNYILKNNSPEDIRDVVKKACFEVVVMEDE